MQFVWGDWAGTYTGEVDSSSIPYGHGLFESNSKKDDVLWRYIGEWKDGLPNGEGAIYYDNCTIEAGTFENGELIKGRRLTAGSISYTEIAQQLTRSAGTEEAAYIGNKHSMRFHLPGCRSVTTMKDTNKVEFFSRDEAIERGYIPCGDCHP